MEIINPTSFSFNNEKFDTNISINNILDNIFLQDSVYDWKNYQIIQNIKNSNLTSELINKYINQFIEKNRNIKIVNFLNKVIKINTSLKLTFFDFYINETNINIIFMKQLIDNILENHIDILDVLVTDLLNVYKIKPILEIIKDIPEYFEPILQIYYQKLYESMLNEKTIDDKYKFIEDRLSIFHSNFNTDLINIKCLEKIINEIFTMDYNLIDNTNVLNIIKHYINYENKNIKNEDISNYFVNNLEKNIDNLVVNDNDLLNPILFKKLLIIFSNINILYTNNIITNLNIIDKIWNKHKDLFGYVNQILSSSIIKLYTISKNNRSELVQKFNNILNLYGLSDNIDVLLKGYLVHLKDRLIKYYDYVDVELEKQLCDAINKNTNIKSYSLIYINECIKDFINSDIFNKQLKKIKITNSSNEIISNSFTTNIIRSDIWENEETPDIKIISELVFCEKVVMKIYDKMYQSRIKTKFAPLLTFIDININNINIRSNLYIISIIYHLYAEELSLDKLYEKILVDITESNKKYIFNILTKLVNSNILEITNDKYKFVAPTEDIIIR